MIGSGASAIKAGILTTPEGVGVVITVEGVAVVATGTAVAVTGASVAASAVSNLGEDAKNFFGQSGGYFDPLFCKIKDALHNGKQDVPFKHTNHPDNTSKTLAKFDAPTRADAIQLVTDVIDNMSDSDIVRYELQSHPSGPRYYVVVDAHRAIGTQGEHFIEIAISATDGTWVHCRPLKNLK